MAKMETMFAVPVFHVGELVYDGYSVEKFDKIDLDLVNLEDLVKLFEDKLGYQAKKKLL
ncbi:hypothetical protein PIB30_011228 [Stylosanthes scabra]|uniref:Uncharacterized protein n=1 Tax=Stylosanthes scabra TaxID=79078 RepID=A0ABU6T7I6_9FABA|nr:hypothetical protein [Stylosanthes scabra]